MRLAAFCSFASSSAPAQVPSGKTIFDSRCAVRQGSDGDGGEFAPGIVVRIAKRTDSDVTAIIDDRLPARGMPARKFDDAERANLIAYLRG